MQIRDRLPLYASLMRLDKPIGILLLLWPTLWALWLAGHGEPTNLICFIFISGVILMRSAGCILNDFADRKVDGYVERTKHRPLATQSISVKEALMLAALLCAISFGLVLFCNTLTIFLAIIGALLALLYPFMKRFTHLPQVGLGVAYSWGIPMAFAAELGEIPLAGWFLYFTALIWPIIYDTMYAMVDREDDKKIGIKSTAILFDSMDRLIIGLLQVLFTVMLIIVGLMFELNSIYYVSICTVVLLFSYQQWLIKDRDREKCFQAFLNNNIVGFAIFIGILSSYMQ